jgi:RNA polymerase sigma-70 factor (ECF subfamily)
MTTTAPDWSAFYRQLHGFVAARVRGAPDVDDLVQLILERAMSKAQDTEIDNAAGWLFGIARNTIADHYRKEARTLVAAADELESTPAAGASDEERAQVVACMVPLLQTMAEDDAQLLRWADMEGRSMQAIAEELGISLTAAKSRVQRARAEFRKTTQRCCAITVDARRRITALIPRGDRSSSCASCVSDVAASNQEKPS